MSGTARIDIELDFKTMTVVERKYDMDGVEVGHQATFNIEFIDGKLGYYRDNWRDDLSHPVIFNEQIAELYSKYINSLITGE